MIFLISVVARLMNKWVTPFQKTPGVRLPPEIWNFSVKISFLLEKNQPMLFDFRGRFPEKMAEPGIHQNCFIFLKQFNVPGDV